MITSMYGLAEMERKDVVEWNTSVVIDQPKTEDYIREKAIEILKQECKKRGIQLIFVDEEDLLQMEKMHLKAIYNEAEQILILGKNISLETIDLHNIFGSLAQSYTA